MKDWPIGLSTGCFYQRKISDCLKPIKQEGFSLIEVCSFPAHLDYHDLQSVKETTTQMDALGIEAYSFHAPFAEHIDITALDPKKRAAAQAEILQAAEAAAILRVCYFVIHPGPEHSYTPPGEERFHRMKNTVNVLNAVAGRCREKGIQLVLENKLPHLLYGNTNDLLWILGGINETNTGTCLDTGHAFLSGDLYRVIHKLSGHLKMIHAHDNRGKGDDHSPPGTGDIDWPRLLRELSFSGFNGTFMLELQGGREIPILLEEARKARSYLRMISRQV